VIAGDRTLIGHIDGTADVSQFQSPAALAIDDDHHCLLVADYTCHVIRSVTLPSHLPSTSTVTASMLSIPTTPLRQRMEWLTTCRAEGGLNEMASKARTGWGQCRYLMKQLRTKLMAFFNPNAPPGSSWIGIDPMDPIKSAIPSSTLFPSMFDDIYMKWQSLNGEQLMAAVIPHMGIHPLAPLVWLHARLPFRAFIGLKYRWMFRDRLMASIPPESMLSGKAREALVTYLTCWSYPEEPLLVDDEKYTKEFWKGLYSKVKSSVRDHLYLGYSTLELLCDYVGNSYSRSDAISFVHQCMIAMPSAMHFRANLAHKMGNHPSSMSALTELQRIYSSNDCKDTTEMVGRLLFVYRLQYSLEDRPEEIHVPWQLWLKFAPNDAVAIHRIVRVSYPCRCFHYAIISVR
jgi:hypothetical protein